MSNIRVPKVGESITIVPYAGSSPRARGLQSLANMMEYGAGELKAGSLDAIGAKRYGKPFNVPDRSVFDLQIVLKAIYPKLNIGEPDGAFGLRTTQGLHEVTGHKEYLRKRDLPLLIALLSKEVVTWLESDATQPDATQEEVKTSNEGAFEPMMVNPPPLFFGQADSRWAMRKMGADMPFKRGACGICSIAMLFNWLAQRHTSTIGEQITPEALDRWMDHNDGYLELDGKRTNILVWSKMVAFAKHSFGQTLEYKQIGSKSNPLEHEEGLERGRHLLIKHKWPLILRVKYRETTSKQWFNHFVLGIGIDDYGEILFLDPRNAQGDDPTHPQNNTAQQINKGGYDVVALEQFAPTLIA